MKVNGKCFVTSSGRGLVTSGYGGNLLK